MSDSCSAPACVAMSVVPLCDDLGASRVACLLLFPWSRWWSGGGVVDRVLAAAATLRAVLAGLEPGAFLARRRRQWSPRSSAATENVCEREGAARGACSGGWCAPRPWVRGRVGLAGECGRVDGARRTGASWKRSSRSRPVRTRMTRWCAVTCHCRRRPRLPAPKPRCRAPKPSCSNWRRPGSLGAVRERARTRRLDAIDRDELYAKQRQARCFAHWRDELGMIRGSFALYPRDRHPTGEPDRRRDRPAAPHREARRRHGRAAASRSPPTRWSASSRALPGPGRGCRCCTW